MSEDSIDKCQKKNIRLMAHYLVPLIKKEKSGDYSNLDLFHLTMFLETLNSIIIFYKSCNRNYFKSLKVFGKVIMGRPPMLVQLDWDDVENDLSMLLELK